MKKDRNSFFESSNYNMSAMGGMMTPNMNMGMPSVNAASSNFYASQNMPMNMMMPTNDNSNDSTMERIYKIERNIQRLDARLTKLESTNYPSAYDDNNMYMV